MRAGRKVCKAIRGRTRTAYTAGGRCWGIYSEHGMSEIFERWNVVDMTELRARDIGC